MLLIGDRETFEGDALIAIREAERLLNGGDYSEAIRKYEEAQRLHGKPSRVIANKMGLAYQFMGDHESAIQSFTTAIRLNDSAVNRIGRSYSYMALLQCEDAISDGLIALEREPAIGQGYHTSANANAVIAECYAFLGEYDIALQHIEMAIAMAEEYGYDDYIIESRENLKDLILETQQSRIPTPTATATATPTPTPAPEPTVVPTSTPQPTALPAVDCPDCHEEYAPIVGHVDWLEPPVVSASGRFSFKARVHDGHDLKIATPEPNGGRYNVNFSSGGELYGSVLPVDNTPGWKWGEKPHWWEADVYDYVGKTLTVVAQIDPAAASHPGLRMCLWSGGKTREDTYILGCIEVEQP